MLKYVKYAKKLIYNIYNKNKITMGGFGYYKMYGVVN
jgi:hypothetical protein